MATKHEALITAYIMLLTIEDGGSFDTKDWYKHMQAIEGTLSDTDREAAMAVVKHHREQRTLELVRLPITANPKGWDKAETATNWKLVDATGYELKVGDNVQFADGGVAIIEKLNPPHKPSSTGKVDVVEQGGFRRLVYPQVFNARFVQA